MRQVEMAKAKGRHETAVIRRGSIFRQWLPSCGGTHRMPKVRVLPQGLNEYFETLLFILPGSIMCGLTIWFTQNLSRKTKALDSRP